MVPWRCMTKKRAAKPSPSDLDDRSEVGGEGVDQDFETVSLVVGGGGVSLFLPMPPAAAYKLSGPVAVRLSDLQEAVMKRRALLAEVDRLVEELREEGVSWNLIGWSVGTTSEAARQRWG